MIDINQWLVFLLILIRILGFLAASPVFSMNNFPKTAKLGLGLILSLIILPLLHPETYQLRYEFFYVLGAMLSESIIGLTLGLAATLVYTGIRMAGEYIDIQIGFSMAQIVDPANGTQNSLMAHFMYLLGILIFFSVDAHHILLLALVKSFDIIMPAGLFLSGEVTAKLIQVFLEMFLIAIRMAIPLVLILIITDMSLGFISKPVPQLNIMMIGFPLKIGVGMIALLVLLPLLGASIAHVYKIMENQLLYLLVRGG